MRCRATQNRRVIVESSDKMWSTGRGNGKPPQYTCHENPMNCIKGHKDMTLKKCIPRLEGVQYATGEAWRTITNSSRKNELTQPKRNWVADVSGDESKIRSRKEQYCIGTWNVRSMSQGKLDMVKQEMARMNTDILGISELKWMEIGEFNFSSVQCSSVAQPCPTLWDPMNCSTPGLPVHHQLLEFT